MIPKVILGKGSTRRLVGYLFGKGTANEHIDPHLVASWNDFAPDPGRSPHRVPKDVKKQLAAQLDQPVAMLGEKAPKATVWHCPVRAAPEDPVLTDAQWADVARRIVAAAGIAPDGDVEACRWIAVRHAEDHIHIAATLVRQDGRRPKRDHDIRAVQREARHVEVDYGLKRLKPGDGTAAKRPTSKEHFKAKRQGRARTVREELRETVRRSVSGAATESEFLDRLQAAGLQVRTRVLPSGDLRGYTVALPGNRNKDGEPVFYAGSTLAPDLSLPRIQARLDTATTPPTPDGAGHRDHRPQRPAPSAARRTATHAAWAALTTTGNGEDGAAAAQIAATGEILDALATTSALHTRQPLREAATVFERASRSHTRAQFRHSRQLRRAARDLFHSGPALGRGEDGATTAMVIDTLFFFALATAHWHAQRRHAQQAVAARQTAAHLQAAYTAASQEPMAHLRAQGQHLAQPVRDWSTALLRHTAPHLAEHVLDEPSWPALAATLTHAHEAGHDPQALLNQALTQRELTTAESISGVLVWRLRHLADLPAHTETTVDGAAAQAPAAPPPTPAVRAHEERRRHR